MSKQNLVLASTSRHRRGLLRRAGLGAVTCVAPRCDEVVDDPAITHVELVRLLSQRKAESAATDFPEALIIGSDQVVEVDGEVLGKPGTAPRAVDQLVRLAGREHTLLSGLCVNEPRSGRSEVGVDVHLMRMWPLERAQLEEYVVHDEPLDCAGSYRIESAGITLFQSMEGSDFTAIVGLPLCQLARILLRFNVTLLELVS